MHINVVLHVSTSRILFCTTVLSLLPAVFDVGEGMSSSTTFSPLQCYIHPRRLITSLRQSWYIHV
ncbi:hypothetical protein SCHPADRAFT_174316 [Schizopora paradoxa]|uniref:Uncharacterized protein n=1 Tax=Schizopora paradoxa TaxID=27342 RepID=A0A0H2SJN1_9AGAM|nr:hypothetical protein SCHPADRAFT_174316 [Schizopora paradoxa]